MNTKCDWICENQRTQAENTGTKFRENQLSSCKVCFKYLPSHQQCIQHDWPTRMASRRQNFCLSLLFKIIHKQTCILLSDITPPTIITSSTIATRPDLNNLPVPFARTDTYKFFWAARLQHLPSYIKEVTLLKTWLATNDYMYLFVIV